MAEVRDTRWLDVINYIDGTGEQQAVQLQREESLRKRAYHQLIDEHCDGRKLIKIRELAQKSQEREEVNRNVREQQLFCQDQRRKRQHFEQQYGQDNKRLFRHTRQKTEPAPENPFVKLVDEEEKRKEIVKGHFLLQNRVNQLQQDMRKQSRDLSRHQAVEQRDTYIKHVEDVFQRRERELAQRRLKYMWKKDSAMMNDPQTEQKRVHRQYLSELQSSFGKKPVHRSHTDNSMNTFEEQTSYNPQIAHSMSPALLGKMPYSHDRKLQLDIVNRKMGINRQPSNLLNHPASQLVNPEQLPPTEFREFKNILLQDDLSRLYPPKTPTNKEAGYIKLRELRKPSQNRSVLDFHENDTEQSPPPRQSQQLEEDLEQVKSVQLPPVTKAARPKTIRTFKTFNIITGSPVNHKLQV